MRKSSSILKHLLSLFILGFVLTGCDSFNNSIKDYLERYTETAGIGASELDGIFPTDDAGIVCIDSDTDHSITLTLRNPKNFPF